VENGQGAKIGRGNKIFENFRKKVFTDSFINPARIVRKTMKESGKKKLMKDSHGKKRDFRPLSCS
jgi:hypothetical protein